VIKLLYVFNRQQRSFFASYSHHVDDDDSGYRPAMFQLKVTV